MFILTEKSNSYTDELGYFSDPSLLKNVIIEQMKSYEDNERILSIYCHTINLDALWDIGYNKFIYFNEYGDITSEFEYDAAFTPNKTYKIGDIIALKNSSNFEPMTIGIVGGLPSNLEETYYILTYSNELIDGELKCDGESFMDHTHKIYQDMYKAEPSKEISKYLKSKLKGIITNDEYQKLCREEKIENILK